MKLPLKKMRNKDYLVAIAEFKNAMKRYKRAKLGPDAYNYLHTNMALCYVSTGKTKDKVDAVFKGFAFFLLL